MFFILLTVAVVKFEPGNLYAFGFLALITLFGQVLMIKLISKIEVDDLSDETKAKFNSTKKSNTNNERLSIHLRDRYSHL